MANVNATVGLDNYAQSGDQTLQQLQNGIQAQTGVHPGIAEQVRDPSTGRLIKVVLTMPDSAAANAAAKITANAGVSTCVVTAPQLNADDLLNSGGIACALNAPNGAYITVLAGDEGTLLGRLDLPGSPGTPGYTDGAELLSAGYIRLGVFAFSGAFPVTIPASEPITLHLSATQSLALVRTNSIVVGGFSYFFVTTDGKLYLSQDGAGIHRWPFEVAAAFPPV